MKIQKKHIKDASNSKIIEGIETVYTQAIKDLTEAHVEYMVTDCHYLERMQVKSDGCLQLPPFSFKTVIIPPSVLMPLSMIKKIVKFAKLDGYVYALGALPSGSAENGMSDSIVFELMEKRSRTSIRIMAEVKVNGILAGERLWPPFTFKIGHLLRPGQNDITVKVGNLVLNAVTQYKDYNWKWYQAPDSNQLNAGLFGPIYIIICENIKT